MTKLEFVIREPDRFDVYCGALKIGSIERYDSIGKTQWYLTFSVVTRVNEAEGLNAAIKAVSKEWKKIEDAMKAKRGEDEDYTYGR